MEKQFTTGKNSHNFNKVGYITFIVAGIIFMFLKDWSNVIIFIGLALVFDPFDTKVPFPKRPLWQRLLLLGHLVIVLSAVIMEIFIK